YVPPLSYISSRLSRDATTRLAAAHTLFVWVRILVVALPPEARLVTTLWGTVEPLVHAPEAVEPSRITGIGVIDDAIFQCECAHAWSLANERCRIRSRNVAGPSGVAREISTP